MKKNVKKVKYSNDECEKQNRRIKITTHVSNNTNNNNKIRYYNTLPAGSAITTPTKISTKPKSKTKVNRTVIILKSMISAPLTSPPIITTATKMFYDQLLNVINKIQSCYHHYYNDPFYRCNIKMLTGNRRYQCKNIKSNIKIKRKSNPKYLIKINNKMNKTSNNNINNNNNNNISSKSSSKISIKRTYIGVAKVCNFERTHTAYKENLKISYQINDYLRQFCFHFQKNFNNLNLLIVIFLLALITSTAHSIDTQEKPQTKSITPIQPPLIKPPSPSLPLSIAAIGVVSNTGTGTTISLDSRYHISNNLNVRFDENFKSYICDKQGHINKNRHLNGNLKLHAKNILTNLKYSSQNTPNTDDQIVKNFSSNYQSNKPQLRHYNHHHHHHNNNNNNSSHHHYHNQNERQNILNTLEDIPNKNHNFNTAVIKFENIFKNYNSNIAKQVTDDDDDEDEEENSGVVRKISELNINNFINHIRLNYNYKQNNKTNNNNNNNISSSSNDTLPSNVDVKNAGNNEQVEADAEDEDANDTTNGHADVDYRNEFDFIDENDYDDDNEIDDNNKGSDVFNLLPTITTPITTLDATTVNSTILQSITNVDLQLQPLTGQQEPAQYDDHAKLMKLVMDGLGLKKPPNMKNVNISQKEYATKYREYLQRVHTRKRRELREDLNYDESFQRPLQLFTIVSNASLLNQTYELNNEIGRLREKRYALKSIEEEESDEESNTEEGDNKSENGKKRRTLEERVKNILFLRKKYQKPRSTKKKRDERKTNIRLMFALMPEILNLSSSDIEEANTRLVLIHSPILAIRNSKNKKTNARKPKKNSCSSSTTENQKTSRHVNVLNIKLYFMQKAGKRILLDSQKIEIQVDQSKPDETHTQWLQFDVTKAVKSALDSKRLEHVVFELQCDNCKRVGARVLNDAYNTAADAQVDNPSTEGYQLMPVLNIIGRFEQSQRSMRPHKYESHWNDEGSNQESTTQRHYHHQSYNKNRNNRRTNCYKSNQRCCRHSMEVTFKEIKGFEFIIQPKVFDAGYCHGRCPPRYNPAHHHAMLQSLIWKQNHHKAPRPCCAPSKLVELEVLHVDEKDSEKLKISTWSDMKVVECACS